MTKFCRPPLRKGEIVTVAQGLFDGLMPTQALARKRLHDLKVMEWEEATNFLKKVGPAVAALVLEADVEGLQVWAIEQHFVAGQDALQNRYKNWPI